MDLLFYNDNYEIWYKSIEFIKNEKEQYEINSLNLIPKFYYYIDIYLDKQFVDSIYLTILINMIELTLNKHTYDAGLAELYYNISKSDHGITFIFSGYSQKLPLLIVSVMKIALEYKFDINIFDLVKNDYITYLKNISLKDPLNQLFIISSLIMTDNYESLNSKIEKVIKLQLADLNKFYDALMTNIYISHIVQGNITINETYIMIDKIMKNFNKKGKITDLTLYNKKFNRL